MIKYKPGFMYGISTLHVIEQLPVQYTIHIVISHIHHTWNDYFNSFDAADYS